MPTDEFPQYLAQFRQLLQECRDLYRTSGELAVREVESLSGEAGRQFFTLMDDLHRGLLVKIFVGIAQCDHLWTEEEKILADALIRHLWGRTLEGDQLRTAIVEMSEKAIRLKWYAVMRPFDQIAPLRNRISEFETLVIRLANLVARADGSLKPIEARQIQSIQDEIHRHLRPIPIDEPAEHAAAYRAAPAAVEKTFQSAAALPSNPPKPATASPGPAPKPAAQRLAEALAELDSLVGLSEVKREVRTLANFLKVQSQRAKAGLPTTGVSLHMVFNGNPGTGKTSVARIVGKIFGAMGMLKKGHLVETDRSGLVAEYAGQTAPKAHKKIDEAIDGVLFIDEAYALRASDGKDPYGNEAVQTLLKRMEDNRDQLVVILAGYPEQMQELLESNPGLTSRFSRQLTFADYEPLELASIFGQMCDTNRYQICSATRARIIAGLSWLHRDRDEHFGNGRTVRNLFEHAIRCQANRIAAIAELSVEQLSTLEPDDVQFPTLPRDRLAPLLQPQARYHIECPHCRHGKDVPEKYLGQTVRCPKCKQDFSAAWGALLQPNDPGRTPNH